MTIISIFRNMSDNQPYAFVAYYKGITKSAVTRSEAIQEVLSEVNI